MNINIVKGRGLWSGITIETREFVEGYYVYDLARRRSVIYKNESIAPGRGTILKSYDVFENTLCQCTGKRDRNLAFYEVGATISVQVFISKIFAQIFLNKKY